MQHGLDDLFSNVSLGPTDAFDVALVNGDRIRPPDRFGDAAFGERSAVVKPEQLAFASQFHPPACLGVGFRFDVDGEAF